MLKPMMAVRKTSLLTIACLSVVLLAGCQLRPEERSIMTEEPAIQNPGAVDVSGFVQRAGKVEIDPDGLSLRQALARAGGVQLAKSTAGLVGSTSTALRYPFVRLQRGGSLLSQQDYYFALPLVTHGLAGSIPLRTGDWIEVVEASEVSIGKRGGSLPAGQRFVVMGQVANPGTYVTEDASTKLSEALAFAGESRSTNLTLTRSKSSGIGTETFFVPVDLPEFKGLLATSLVRDGDVYQLVELSVNPVVLTALVEPLLKRSSRTSELSRSLRQSPRRVLGQDSLQPPSGSLRERIRDSVANLPGVTR